MKIDIHHDGFAWRGTLAEDPRFFLRREVTSENDVVTDILPGDASEMCVCEALVAFLDKTGWPEVLRFSDVTICGTRSYTAGSPTQAWLHAIVERCARSRGLITLAISSETKHGKTDLVFTLGQASPQARWLTRN